LHAERVVCGGGVEEVDMRLHAIVHRLDCTSDVGWGRIMGYATAEECVRTYAQLCVAFGPGARVKRSVWFLRKKMVTAYFTPAVRASVFSLVSVAFRAAVLADRRKPLQKHTGPWSWYKYRECCGCTDKHSTYCCAPTTTHAHNSTSAW
jgi:hypothetical protein